METLKGKGGICIPRLGLGTWRMSEKEAEASVMHALSHGLFHIDTAAVYKNESAIACAIRQSGVPRDKIFLTTKLWKDRLQNSASVLLGAEESLQRLQTDYLDLLLIHWPFPGISLKTCLEGLMKAKTQGKIRAFGVSNFNVSLLNEAAQTCPHLTMHQAEYHPLLCQSDLLSAGERHRMLFTAYSPLAGGHIMKIQQLRHIGAKYKKSPAQIALRWLMDQKNVIAVFKSKTPERILSNMQVFDFQLDAADRRKIHKLSENRFRTLNPPFAPPWDK